MKTVIRLGSEETGETRASHAEKPRLGRLIREARLEKGLTQEQLAERCGSTKAYISKVENDVKDIRFSSLQKIVETGLGGQLNLSITI